MWRRAQPARLDSLTDDDRDWPAEVHLAYDDEFLYLAARCTKSPDIEYPAAGATARRRDTDLSHHDRMELYLDIDRDFSTYYRLTADHRGWPSDGCWGDPSWNPTWFIATGGDETSWTLEAAIPFEELTGRYPGERDVWAIGLQRIVPGVGFQSWTNPAAVEVIPAGFGYLVFEAERR